jgi:hypothetical protein
MKPMKPKKTKKTTKTRNVRKFAHGGDMRGNAAPAPGAIGYTTAGGDGIQGNITAIENDSGLVGQTSMMAGRAIDSISDKIGTPGTGITYTRGGAVNKKAAKKPSRSVKKFAVGGDMRVPSPAPVDILPDPVLPRPTTPNPTTPTPSNPTTSPLGGTGRKGSSVKDQLGTIGKASSNIRNNAVQARTGLKDVQKDLGGGTSRPYPATIGGDPGTLFADGGAVKKSTKKSTKESTKKSTKKSTSKPTRVTTKKPPQKSSSKVRGAGIAQRGVRKAKMR